VNALEALAGNRPERSEGSRRSAPPLRQFAKSDSNN
jgi:hypothetical protein